jgi:hypothetical protein
LEACLRSGLDPAELFPKSRASFNAKNLTKEMADIKFDAFEKKRLDKIDIVKKERTAIIQYAERKQMMGSRGANIGDQSSRGATQHEFVEEKGGIGMIEMEERRIEALRRRQEKELSKIVERETTMAALQQKIKRAEDEEVKKKVHNVHFKTLNYSNSDHSTETA